MFCHTLGIASASVLCHNVFSSLSSSSVFHSVITTYSDPVFPNLLIKSKSSVSLMLSSTAFCAFCTSTLQAQSKTWSLLISMVSFSVVNFFTASTVIVSSFSHLESVLSASCHIPNIYILLPLFIVFPSTPHIFSIAYNIAMTIWSHYAVV